jgi:hypothetical protein
MEGLLAENFDPNREEAVRMAEAAEYEEGRRI